MINKCDTKNVENMKKRGFLGMSSFSMKQARFCHEVNLNYR